MDISSLQKYVFREQGDKTLIGGYPVEKIAREEQEKFNGGGDIIETQSSNSRLQNLVVPVGLYMSGGRNSALIGGNGIPIKETTGGTIEEKEFHKLFDMIATKKEGKPKTKKIRK